MAFSPSRKPFGRVAPAAAALCVCAALMLAAAPSAAAAPTETVLHALTGYPTDGGVPSAGLILDGAGNLYGTAGGGASGYGTVFKLTPNGTLFR